MTKTKTASEEVVVTGVTESEPILSKVVKTEEGVIVEAQLEAVSVRTHGVGVSEN